MAAMWWGFGSFLFYKVASTLMFEDGLNLVTSGLVGVLAGAAIYGLGAATATIYGMRRVKQVFGSEPEGVMRQQMFVAVAIAATVTAALGWAVIIGFDPSFADRISLGLVENLSYPSSFYRHLRTLLWAMAVFALPVAINGLWGIMLYSAMARSTRERP